MDALSTLFARFLRERRFLKNVTPKTIIWYETAFQALTRTVVVSGPDDLSKSALQDFVVGLRERGLSPVSCNTYGKAINALLAWLRTEGHLAEALSLPPQRTEKRVVRTLSDEHLKRLLGFKPKTVAHGRAYALACTLTDTGIRIEEALGLRHADVDFDNLLLTVRGKGLACRLM